MGLIVYTGNPKALLAALERDVADGTVQTWARDDEGDYTHAPAQWQRKAWMRPRLKSDRLVFSIIGQKDVTMSKLIYAVYHGRFAEMLLTHFDTMFTTAVSTATRDGEDHYS